MTKTKINKYLKRIYT